MCWSEAGAWSVRYTEWTCQDAIAVFHLLMPHLLLCFIYSCHTCLFTCSFILFCKLSIVILHCQYCVQPGMHESHINWGGTLSQTTYLRTPSRISQSSLVSTGSLKKSSRLKRAEPHSRLQPILLYPFCEGRIDSIFLKKVAR